MASKPSTAPVKTVFVPVIALASLADIGSEEEQLRARLAELAARKGEVRTTELGKVAAYLDTLPGLFEKATGRTMNLGEIAVAAKQHAAGTFLTSGGSTSSGEGRARTLLSDETRNALRVELMAREIALKGGKPAEQLSTIRDRHNVSDSAIKTYRPDQAAINAEWTKLQTAAPAAV